MYKTTVSCLNATITELCSSGYYCPNATEKVECPTGYFCAQGFSEPTICAWGSIDCPYRMMVHPLHGISFAMFLFTFSILLAVSKFLITKIIKMQNVKVEDVGQDVYDDKMQAEVQGRVVLLKYEKIHSVMCNEFKSRNGIQRVLITSDTLFNAIDKDNSGFITISELYDFNRNKIELLEEMVTEADKDMNGTLERQEFKELWHKIALPKRRKSYFEMDKSIKGILSIILREI